MSARFVIHIAANVKAKKIVQRKKKRNILNDIYTSTNTCQL